MVTQDRLRALAEQLTCIAPTTDTETAPTYQPNIREALEWLVNLGCGVGRAGGPPEHGEIETAIEYGKDALAPVSPVRQDATETLPERMSPNEIPNLGEPFDD
jgi:hypothetical protein